MLETKDLSLAGKRNRGIVLCIDESLYYPNINNKSK